MTHLGKTRIFTLIVLTALLTSLLSHTYVVSSEKVILSNVPYYPMHHATCAITALQMILSYYGYNYSHTLLMVISGWDFGIYYSSKYRFGFGCSPYPVLAVIFTAKQLGFNATYKTFSDFNEALSWVKENLRRGDPVFLEIKGHSVVAVGFDDEEGALYIHDPSGGISSWEFLAEGFALGLNVSRYVEEITRREGFGAFVKVPYDKMRELWRWYRGYEAVLIKPVNPVTDLTKIKWADIFDRIVTNTLHGLEFPEEEGVNAWLKLVNDLRGNYSRDYLIVVRDFILGIAWRNRDDAASFFTGLSTALNIPELRGVSWYFRMTASEYGLAYSLLGYVILHYNDTDISNYVIRAANHIEKGIQYEKKAAELLSKVSKVLRLKQKETETTTPAPQTISALNAMYILAGFVLGLAVGAAIFKVKARRFAWKR
ncbi:MAG: hypothetical protein DRO18_01975 [Thermoprotei archaeon]|nr:MAG: hypothetical protein DRO18_01975 [Thermoprotei archaeon]